MSSVTHSLEWRPVAFAAEPAQVFQVPDGAVLGDWLAENIPGFDPERDDIVYSQPLNAPVHSRVVAEFAPKGGAIQSILKPVFKLLGLTVKTPKAPAQQRNDDIELAAFEGNTVRYGQVVRESFGMTKIFPDYLVPRRRYFRDKRDHWAEMLLCVGVGFYDVPLSTVTFGRSSVIGLGGYAQVYQPGESLAGESAAEWWYTAPEVGATTTSGGLPLETVFPATRYAPDGLYQFSGKTITPMRGQSLPGDWAIGMYLDLRYYHGYQVSGNTLSGEFSGLQVGAGDRVEIEGDYDGTFTVQSFTPATGGTPGTASLWTASSAPSLNYSATPAQFSVNIGLISGVLSISGDYPNEAALVSALNSAVAETSLNGLIQFEAGLAIRELPPYAGWRITVTDLSEASRMFGDIGMSNTLTAVGQPASSGSGATLSLSGFAADTNTAHLSISKQGERFIITSASPSIVGVDRVDDLGDSDWAGWGAGFQTVDADISLGADSSEGGWAGPYRATPADELCTALEFDVMFPQGLSYTKSSGSTRTSEVTIEFAYRGGPGDPWETVQRTYREGEKKMIAFTERVSFSSPRRITETRMRRITAESTHYKTMNICEWFGLRAKIHGAPTSYPYFTTVAIKVKGSSTVGIEADEMLGVIATRILDGVPERRISKAVEYIARRVPVDTTALNLLELAHWSPRNDYFDFSFETHATIKQAVRKALVVGFSDFSIEDGLLTPVRDQAIPPELMYAFWQTFSAQNTTQPITTEFEMISDDETDGIDVEYLDQTTWRIETVRCMEPGSLGLKIEKIRADGIIDRDRAYRFGMRDLMTRKTERERIRTQTELSGLNSGYGRYVNFVNEIPGWSRSSVVKSFSGAVLESADTLDWQDGKDHVVALRRPDGTLTSVLNAEFVGPNRILVTGSFGFTPTPYDTHLFFGVRERMATPAIMREVRPSGTNRVNLMAIAYNPEKYIYDDAEADN